ncbi:MAG TPA: hypothetical protein DD379_10885 [Cyanobacteria bacterium UBA11162]|nr:hypothetical protein [Cyanobacteria bacterium UBA11162]
MQFAKNTKKRTGIGIIPSVIGILAYLVNLILPYIFSANEQKKVNEPPVHYFFDNRSFTDNSEKNYWFPNNSGNNYSFTDNSVKNYSFPDNSVNGSFNNYFFKDNSVNDSFNDNSFNLKFSPYNQNDIQIDSSNWNENQFLLVNLADVGIRLSPCCNRVNINEDKRPKVYKVAVAPGGSKDWADSSEAASW